MDTKQRKSELMSPRLNVPLAALGIAAMLATPAFAQSGASTTKSAPAQASQAPAQAQAPAQDHAQSQKQTMPDQVAVLPARSIVGRDVRDAAGTDLGKVKYLMVNAVDGRVRYAIVEPKTGADDQYVPVPWQAVKLPRDQNDPLSVDSGKFDRQKRFSKQEIADLTQPAVITSVYEVWAPLMTDQSQAGQGQGKTSDEKSQSQSQPQAQQAMGGKDNKTSQTKAGQQQAASGGAEAAPDFLVDSDIVTTIMPPAFVTSDEIRGSEVYSDDNKEYGKIDNLIIDTKRGQVAYVQVAHGGFLGLGERVTPVPYEAMAYDHDRNAYVVGKTASELNDMQGFSADKNVNSVKLVDLRTLYSNFGVKPYWQQNS